MQVKMWLSCESLGALLLLLWGFRTTPLASTLLPALTLSLPPIHLIELSQFEIVSVSFCHHSLPNSSSLYSKPYFPILLSTQRGYLILATTSLQLMNSVNILRITTGHFLALWPRNYSKLFFFFFDKNSRMTESPKRMPVKITSKGIVGLSLESVPLFIHPFIPQGQTVNHAYFCRHCETFSRFYVRSFCKSDQHARDLLWRQRWGLQEMQRTTKCALINGTFEVGKEGVAFHSTDGVTWT